MTILREPPAPAPGVAETNAVLDERAEQEAEARLVYPVYAAIR